MKIKSIQKTIDKIRGKDKKKNNFETLDFVIAMLKAYNVKYIVASPGIQNAQFNYLVQNDDFFKCFSVVDERSAAYVALGLAIETASPVVITCTGATSSRNYLSALTEAYYRKIPLIALTFFNPFGNQFNMSPQYIDRSVSQNDIKSLSVNLPRVHDNIDRTQTIVNLNVSLATAKYKSMPVHINCPSSFNWHKNENKKYPDVWSTQCVYDNFEKYADELKNKKVAIYIGSHCKFEGSLQKNIEKFALSWNAPVFCDHTSSYKGKNKVLFSRFISMLKTNEYPDVIIDIGSISGEYSSYSLLNGVTVWRISDDQSVKFRNNSVVNKIFMCRENVFFDKMQAQQKSDVDYYKIVSDKLKNIKIPDLPLCNALISYYVSKKIPANSVLNVSILNSLRNMNFFDLDESIDFNCNVGGFGIDGQVSSLIGMSLANPDKLYFGVIGDLAFFYDMNILGNRHIRNNLRIIVINNNRGEEFRIPDDLEKLFGNETDTLVAAAHHFSGGAKAWAEANKFNYMSACNKNEFLNKIDGFFSLKSDKPLLFEVFTTNEDEIKGINLIRDFNK